MMKDWSVTQSILHWSTHTPDAIAVERLPHQFTYRRMAIDIVQLARALQADGLRAGMLVGIGSPDRYAHLLLALACQVIGATSASVEPEDMQQPSALRVHWQMLLTTSQIRDAEVPTIVITEAYLRAVPASVPADFALLDQSQPDDFVERIIKSSGTTGQKKYMPWMARLTRCAIDRRLDIFGLAGRNYNFPNTRPAIFCVI